MVDTEVFVVTLESHEEENIPGTRKSCHSSGMALVIDTSNVKLSGAVVTSSPPPPPPLLLVVVLPLLPPLLLLLLLLLLPLLLLGYARRRSTTSCNVAPRTALPPPSAK